MNTVVKRIKLFLTRPEEIFVVIALSFGLASVFMMPLLSVNDEGAHFQRAYEIGTGQFGRTGCAFPSEILSGVSSGNDITKPIPKSNDKIDFSDSNLTKNQSCGPASPYSPIMHLPQAIGVFIAKLFYPSTGSMIVGGRIANLLFYILVIYLTVKYVRVGKWAFATIAMIPMLIHLAASLSADVMNNVVVFAYIAAMLSAFATNSKLSKAHLATLFTLAILLPVTKMPNAILLLPLLFLSPKQLPVNSKRFKSIPFSIYKYLFGIGILFAGAVLIFGWQTIYNAPLISEASNNPLISNPWHFTTILFNTYANAGIGYADILFRGLTGIFSFRFSYPTYITVITWVTILVTLFYKNKVDVERLGKKSKQLSILVIVSGVLFVLAVTYALYTAWAILPSRLGPGAAYADGVQGRYFTPLLTLLIPVAIYLWRYISISISVKREYVLGIIVFTSISFQMLYYLYQLYGITH